MWVRRQEPHDPLLPGGPMSCQSAPGACFIPPSCKLLYIVCNKPVFKSILRGAFLSLF
ncbi:unnamed protein product [Staurois parvus]|uniref:Uncharacterized protein n=1 Tax=Staurois parvus TaxID=386267 RepID=A0ABN9D8K8_9NEOB|nr:unnamed protein product [Staurois parvus]